MDTFLGVGESEVGMHYRSAVRARLSCRETFVYCDGTFPGQPRRQPGSFGVNTGGTL